MEENKKLRYRMTAICLVYMLLLIVFFVTMFNAQIVHGADYRSQSVRTNTSVETVEASRGIITRSTR